jgi:hypothetical protein
MTLAPSRPRREANGIENNAVECDPMFAVFMVVGPPLGERLEHGARD